MRTRVKNISSIILKAAFAVAILYYLASQGKLDLEVLVSFFTNPRSLFLLTSSFIVAVLLGVVRYHQLMLAQGIKQSIKDTFCLTMIGSFFNTTLPGAVSGDVVKFIYLSKLHPGITKTKGFVSMLVDRITGLSALFILSSIGLFFLDSENIIIKQLATFIKIGMFLIICGYGFVLSPFNEAKKSLRNLLSKLPLKNTILKIYDAILIYQTTPGVLFTTILISIAIHTIIVGNFYFVAQELNLPASFGQLILTVPMGLITTAIPIAPAGIGVGHAVFEKLLDAYSIPHGANLFNVVISFQILVNLLGGIVYLAYKPRPIDSSFKTHLD